MHRFWPAPAFISWLIVWAFYFGLQHEMPVALQFALPAMLGFGLALWTFIANTPWRAFIVASGFPVSVGLIAFVNQGWLGGEVHSWVWLLLMTLLLLVYPVRSWQDAPVFPTPKNALLPLSTIVHLPSNANVLDAGCGLGHGLVALRDTFPTAVFHGIEWSWPLSLWCQWRFRWASVRRGDLWAQNWAPFDLVYVFQRPESMPRIWTKAQSELKPGAWLVSLDFGVLGVKPTAQIQQNSTRMLWAYRIENK